MQIVQNRKDVTSRVLSIIQRRDAAWWEGLYILSM